MPGNGLSRQNPYTNLSIETDTKSVVDDGTIELKSGVAGWGFVMAGDNEESTNFTFTSAGVVTLGGEATTNTANTDSDANLCVYDGGTNVIIKNRLAGTKTIRYEVKYS